MVERLIYKGQEFALEWYFDELGKSQAHEYFLNLSKARKKKALFLFQMMGDAGQIRNITKFRNEGDGIYAFKPQPDRFLSFFFSEQKVIVTNAFTKKQDKMPKSEKQKALRIKENYLKRVKNRAYYGQEEN